MRRGLPLAALFAAKNYPRTRALMELERANAGLRVAAVVVIVVILVLRQAEGQSNIDTRLPIMRRSPGRTNESHYESHGSDLFGFAIAFHEIEEVALETDGAQEAADKTR